MEDIKKDLVRLRREIESRLNTPGILDRERAELFFTLNLIKKEIRAGKTERT